MSNPSFRISEPNLPEHQLLRDAGSLPQLSTGLRDRVLIDCHRQVRNGRWADRLRIAGAVLAASLMAALVWNFRWTGPSDRAETAPDVVTTPSEQSTYPPPWSSLNAESPADPKADPALPQGGPSNRPEMKEMQQINQLIEELGGRNNTLCSFLPMW